MVSVEQLNLRESSIALFYVCMGLGLLLHVLVKVDSWWKPEFSKTGLTVFSYFAQYPVRSLVSAVATLLVGLLLWEFEVRNALAATAAGYMGNSVLDAWLGTRKAD